MGINLQLEQKWMQRALELAAQAEAEGEVPIGAVVVFQNQIIAEGYNQPISLNDPTAHAEIIALRNAAKKIANYRLLDCELYVTLEPCAMCATAMVHSRIARLVYGASDPKTGAVDSVMNLLEHPAMNHKVRVTSGVLAEPAAKLLKQFFQKRR